MKASKLRVSFETVTPEMAAEFLTRNKSNRPFRQTWADEWAGRIRRGEWMPTHQGIAFDLMVDCAVITSADANLDRRAAVNPPGCVLSAGGAP